MNRQELKFDAKEKMRQAAVNPMWLPSSWESSSLLCLLFRWFSMSGVSSSPRELPSAEENSVHTSFPPLYFCCLLIDQYNSAVWLQLLLFEGGEPGQFHVLRGFVFVAEISAEGHRTDAYDLNICYAVVSVADYTGYHCRVPLFPGHLHHG